MMMTKNANGNYVLHVEFSADELDLAMACCSNAFAQVITEKNRADNACACPCPCCEDEDEDDDDDYEAVFDEDYHLEMERRAYTREHKENNNYDAGHKDGYEKGYDAGYDAAIAEMREWLGD